MSVRGHAFVFVSKGYRQGNTRSLMLCCVFKAERTEINLRGWASKENESEMGNEQCILWDPCVCTGFVTYLLPSAHSSCAPLPLPFPQVVMSQRLGSSLRRKVSETETQLLALHEAKLDAISGYSPSTITTLGTWPVCLFWLELMGNHASSYLNSFSKHYLHK